VSQRPLRVTVVGAGPSGIFTAASLVEQSDVPVEVHVVDRLPTPFGLVRYGVAPDHTTIRNVRRRLQSTLEHASVRFSGNVEVGTDVSVAELMASADAVVFAYGASRDRALGIPGEDLPGMLAATQLVSWYCGHPDADRDLVEALLRDVKSAAIVGVGNVAVDVARILAAGGDALEQTDMPQHVLDVLAATQLTDIHLVGRRGPAHAAFTSKELRELGTLVNVDVHVDAADLEMTDEEAERAEADPVVRRNLAILREWAGREPRGAARRIHVRFWSRPVEVLGRDSAEHLRIERTSIDATGRLVGTGAGVDIAAQLLVRSVGYRSAPLDGVPFDEVSSTVPNQAGRVHVGAEPVSGQYVVGWLKRGPSGIIGTNKVDALQTASSVLADAPLLLQRPLPVLDLTEALVGRGLATTDIAAWHLIDAAEISLGASRGRPRTTLHDRHDLMTAARRP
jgi:NADPH-dependent glutamate synthase beta subunit-like oxidoreductase